MKLSVIVTVHAGTEKYFEECLESIKAQVVKPHEIIVVVDGYIKPMIYPDTTTIIRNQNKGIAFSRDQGVKLSTGNYLLFIDADDVIPEDYIMRMASVIRWKKADIIYPSCLLWCKWGTEAPQENGFFDPPNMITLDNMLVRNNILISSVIKREVYDRIGGFDPDLIMFEDWYFFLEALVLKYKFHHAGTFLKYRQRQLSRNHVNEEHKARITQKIRDMILTKYPLLKTKMKKIQ